MKKVVFTFILSASLLLSAKTFTPVFAAEYVADEGIIFLTDMIRD